MLSGKALRKLGKCATLAGGGGSGIVVFADGGTVYAACNVHDAVCITKIGRDNISPFIIKEARSVVTLPDSVTMDGDFLTGHCLRLRTIPAEGHIVNDIDRSPEGMVVFPYFGWIVKAMRACSGPAGPESATASVIKTADDVFVIAVQGDSGYAVKQIGSGDYQEFSCCYREAVLVEAITDRIEIVCVARRANDVHVMGNQGYLVFKNKPVVERLGKEAATPLAGAAVIKTEIRKALKSAGEVVRLVIRDDRPVIAGVYPTVCCGDYELEVRRQQLREAIECLNAKTVGITAYPQTVEFCSDMERVGLDKVVDQR